MEDDTYTANCYLVDNLLREILCCLQLAYDLCKASLSYV